MGISAKNVVPFKTSFISPGGDCNRNFEAAWIRSFWSIGGGEGQLQLQ